MKSALRVSVVALAVVAASPVLATELTYFTTVLNTDYQAFGAGGMRGQGTGSIVVSGVSGTVSHAYLFWQGPTNDTGDTNASVTFNGTAIVGVNIGNSASNCWDSAYANSKAYRADVTSQVSGNGSYALANFIKGASGATADINGVSLVIFYDDGNTANNRDVVIFSGNDSNVSNAFDVAGWNATLAGINYSTGTVNMFMIVADGQTFGDDAFQINGTTILPNCGNNWQGNTVPDQGTGSATNGGLWDQRLFDVTSLVSPGPNTLTIQPTAECSDCLSMVAAVFDLPAGAAPPTPTPTPGPPTPTPTPTPIPTGPALVPTLDTRGLFALAAIIAAAGMLLGRRILK